MKQFGLIGFPLGHSFSKAYFTEKFEKLGLPDHVYELFPIERIQLFPDIWDQNPDLVGLNVTVPYKEAVISYLDQLDESAQKVGAVNVIKKSEKGLTGYNSDYFGFKKSLEGFARGKEINKALILGTGGASKAVKAVLDDMSIHASFVTRHPKGDLIGYDKLKAEGLAGFELIVNSTPLGMYPSVADAPDIPYEQIRPYHLLFDLVYNPEVTMFMKKGQEQGANVKNGLEMLHLQADRAWEIWKS